MSTFLDGVLSGDCHDGFSMDPTASLSEAIRQYGLRFKEMPHEVVTSPGAWPIAFNGVWLPAKCGCCPHKQTKLYWMGVLVRPEIIAEAPMAWNIYEVRGPSGVVRVRWQ